MLLLLLFYCYFSQLLLNKGAILEETGRQQLCHHHWLTPNAWEAAFPGTAHTAHLPLPLAVFAPSREKEHGQITNGASTTRQPLFFVMTFSYCESSLRSLLYKPPGGFLIFLLIFAPSVFSESPQGIFILSLESAVSFINSFSLLL